MKKKKTKSRILKLTHDDRAQNVYDDSMMKTKNKAIEKYLLLKVILTIARIVNFVCFAKQWDCVWWMNSPTKADDSHSSTSRALRNYTFYHISFTLHHLFACNFRLCAISSVLHLTLVGICTRPTFGDVSFYFQRII